MAPIQFPVARFGVPAFIYSKFVAFELEKHQPTNFINIHTRMGLLVLTNIKHIHGE